jgi:hypothetical protein
MARSSVLDWTIAEARDRGAVSLGGFGDTIASPPGVDPSMVPGAAARRLAQEWAAKYAPSTAAPASTAGGAPGMYGAPSSSMGDALASLGHAWDAKLPPGTPLTWGAAAVDKAKEIGQLATDVKQTQADVGQAARDTSEAAKTSAGFVDSLRKVTRGIVVVGVVAVGIGLAVVLVGHKK